MVVVMEEMYEGRRRVRGTEVFQAVALFFACWTVFDTAVVMIVNLGEGNSK